MIYYFSGTGNSKWVAETLAIATKDKARDIATLQHGDGGVITAYAGDCLGIVFPIYAWGAPKIVEQFCNRIRCESGAYVYAVCTCGDDAGRAMDRLKRVLPIRAAWSIAMPNNYVPGFDVDTVEEVRFKINAARERLPEIAHAVTERASEYNVHTGAGARVKTAVFHPLFNVFAQSTKPFFVTSDCTACGLCARSCPSDTIEMRDGNPVWTQRSCLQCMRCINRCPAKAIQYGKATRKRGRYAFDEEILDG